MERGDYVSVIEQPDGEIAATGRDPQSVKSNALAAVARIDREKLLLEADHKVNFCNDNGIDATPWRSYRQSLRDITDQEGFPESISWPVKPE